MDATRRVACNPELLNVNPILTMGMQISFILVVSHFFQLVLKPLGQPGPIAQILSGLVLGPSGLSHITYIKEVFFQDLAGDYYQTLALFARIIIMFLIGLEMDLQYLHRNLRTASVIASGGCLICSMLAAAITPFICQQTEVHSHVVMVAVMLAVVLANAASPIVIRLASELRFATTDFGRLVISSSLICDLYAAVLLTLSSRSKHGRKFMTWAFHGCLALFMMITVIFLNIYLVNWLNRRNRYQKSLKNTEAFAILSVVVIAAMAIEMLGFNSIIACFFIGSMFPKRGKTARTLLPKLSYSVQNFIFPVYLGYLGFQADISVINSLSNFSVVFVIILLSLGGKISGTLAACYYLKIPLNEGVLFAFLMNLKGYADLVTIGLGYQDNVITSQLLYGLMISTLVINTLVVGPIIAFMVRRESDILGFKHIALEWQTADSELRILACVHNPRHLSTMFGLIAALGGPEKGPIAPYFMHLIELPEKTKSHLMYHQREDDELSDEDNYGGNDVVEINEAVDNFTAETGVMVHQLKAVSPFLNMYTDVCDRAEEMHASIILLHFHKHQRIDGKMETGKEGIRTTNQKVLRHAKCSVSILVDRGLAGDSLASGTESLQQAAALFFGGPDDREALSFSRRLGTHHHIKLTVIRFLPASSKGQNFGVNVAHKAEDVFMAISDQETDNEADTAVLSDFYNRYVTSGQVGYKEKYVENGQQTASTLRDMADMYSLFIVGKGKPAQSPLTTGMSDWEECAELGAVGDLLASSDFDNSGSVLVIQQHRISKKESEQ
ncbi:cation/H(+) antiporter 2-like isoform X1 [Diospyros lotus]|uniref:cation/H(+) antiporter 2-like isoform X1 n=2 Tax=Diospyros lotus TaxID=55363 RepID=UPI0022568AB1|nr:cation/H(+) antiporter 2-like isoform X1 [Diospyros lotus]